MHFDEINLWDSEKDKQRKENIYEIEESIDIEDTDSIMIKNYENYEYYNYDRSDDEDKKDIISSENLNKQKKI